MSRSRRPNLLIAKSQISTVSKVLRQKEKYLFPEDQTTSPVKRSKGKFPDVERALTVWVRNQSKRGIPLTDTSIRDEARKFAAQGDSGLVQKFHSSAWLQKFKQKTGIQGGKLTRRASETNISDRRSINRQGSDGPPPASQTPNEISPASENLLASPSPLSGTKSEDDFKPDSLNSYFSLSNGSNRYKHSNSQSTTSLASNFTDHGPTSFSAGPTSPTTPFAFSPETTQAPWQPSLHLRQPPISNAFQRPRSQTFPMLGIDPSFISTHSNEPLTPKYNLPVTAPPSALDSPMNEMAPPFGMDSAISSPHLHHSSSNSSMGPPASGTPITGLQSPPGSSAANSPTTQDDARRALETLLSFFSQAPSGFVDQNEYMTIIKLTEKLHIQHNTSTLPGGLHRIAEQDCEVAPKMEHSMSLVARFSTNHLYISRAKNDVCSIRLGPYNPLHYISTALQFTFSSAPAQFLHPASKPASQRTFLHLPSTSYRVLIYPSPNTFTYANTSCHLTLLRHTVWGNVQAGT